MNEKIANYLRANDLLHLSVIHRGRPYGASCFYIFDEKRWALLFASSPDSVHMRALVEDWNVAGTIACCDQSIARLRGVQFQGVARVASEEQKRLYTRKYPQILAIREPVWAIELHWIKMTDNSLGFGKKIEWRRHS